MRVPRRYVFISDWPIYTMTINFICLKIKIAPSITLSTPNDRSAAKNISSYPIKRLILIVYVRINTIIIKKMIIFRIHYNRVMIKSFFLSFLWWPLSSIREIKICFIFCNVIFSVLYFSTTIDKQCFETFFC